MPLDIYIDSLVLDNYKNYHSATFKFIKGFNLIAGKNGMGKTNVLDAIYYQSLLKSNFALRDMDLINHESNYFRIAGEWTIGSNSGLLSIGMDKSRKKITFEQEEIKKRSEWVGRIPLFLICPEDHTLIIDGSKDRRAMIDHLLSILDVEYFESLLKYNRLLKQRNEYLKSSTSNSINREFLITYSQQMDNLAQFIHEKRLELADNIELLFNKNYNAISSANESCSLEYKSQLFGGNLKKLHIKNIEKDLILRRTTVGIHKDDWVFKITGKRLKYFGSQGQQKSFLLSVKLSLAEIYMQRTGKIPLLLLDDLFDKLDVFRIKNLFRLLKESEYTQVIITDTNAERSEKHFEALGINFKIFEVENGAIINEKEG